MTLVSDGLLYLGTANNAGTRSIRTEVGSPNPLFCLSDAFRDYDPGGSTLCMSEYYGYTAVFTFTINGGDTAINGLANIQEANLATLATAAGWGGSDAMIVTIADDVWIWSDDTSIPALTIPSNIPSGSMIINNGNIIGAGGAGGDNRENLNGGDGGDAIMVSASGITIQNNAGAFIAGGGGGGGLNVTDRGDAESNGGGGGAGGGRGGNGDRVRNRGAGGVIGGLSTGTEAGASAGGAGGSGSRGSGGGGGRVLPGTAFNGGGAGGQDGDAGTISRGPGGGGWGADGGSGVQGAGGAGGAGIEGTATVVNNGTIYGAGSPITLLSGAVNGGDRGATATITPTTVPTFPAGSVAVFSNNSTGTSNPLKTAVLRFDGVEVARFSSGVGGTPGSFCRTDGAATSTPITITGGPYTPSVITLQVTGAATTLVRLPCPANISSSVTVTASPSIFAQQSFTGSGTVSLTGSGPAWVWLSGGGGSGGAFIKSAAPAPQAGPGGAGGMVGVFLPDVSVLAGATYSVGAGGAGRSVSGTQDSNPGIAGTTSSLSGGGITLSATGGGAGSEINFGAGAAGAGTATGATALDLAATTTAARNYWNGFIGSDGNTLGSMVSFGGGGAGGAFNTISGGSSTSGRSGAGGAGQLVIVYQNQ